MEEINDPLELKVANTLTECKINFTTPAFRHDPTGLDFRLDNGVEIEVKAFFSTRSERQLRDNQNVILLQGKAAVDTFCKLIERV